ncbi:MAG: hypothetical protein ACI87W_000631 [Halieaceae bacterium]|jgi:hypothetical protein
MNPGFTKGLGALSDRQPDANSNVSRDIEILDDLAEAIPESIQRDYSSYRGDHCCDHCCDQGSEASGPRSRPTSEMRQ